jgi:hypothetical protein
MFLPCVINIYNFLKMSKYMKIIFKSVVKYFSIIIKLIYQLTKLINGEEKW